MPCPAPAGGPTASRPFSHQLAVCRGRRVCRGPDPLLGTQSPHRPYGPLTSRWLLLSVSLGVQGPRSPLDPARCVGRNRTVLCGSRRTSPGPTPGPRGTQKQGLTGSWGSPLGPADRAKLLWGVQGQDPQPQAPIPPPQGRPEGTRGWRLWVLLPDETHARGGREAGTVRGPRAGRVGGKEGRVFVHGGVCHQATCSPFFRAVGRTDGRGRPCRPQSVAVDRPGEPWGVRRRRQRSSRAGSS